VFDNFSANVVVEGITYNLGLGIQFEGKKITISCSSKVSAYRNPFAQLYPDA
jgi:hypothetical protein